MQSQVLVAVKYLGEFNQNRWSMHTYIYNVLFYSNIIVEETNEILQILTETSTVRKIVL